MSVEDTLKERGSVHGRFSENSEISQLLKSILSDYAKCMTYVQREALDLIAHKIARILAGDANHTDHWHDIAGYATLVEKDIESKKCTNPVSISSSSLSPIESHILGIAPALSEPLSSLVRGCQKADCTGSISKLLPKNDS